MITLYWIVSVNKKYIYMDEAREQKMNANHSSLFIKGTIIQVSFLLTPFLDLSTVKYPFVLGIGTFYF